MSTENGNGVTRMGDAYSIVTKVANSATEHFMRESYYNGTAFNASVFQTFPFYREGKVYQAVFHNGRPFQNLTALMQGLRFNTSGNANVGNFGNGAKYAGICIAGSKYHEIEVVMASWTPEQGFQAATLRNQSEGSGKVMPSTEYWEKFLADMLAGQDFTTGYIAREGNYQQRGREDNLQIPVEAIQNHRLMNPQAHAGGVDFRIVQRLVGGPGEETNLTSMIEKCQKERLRGGNDRFHSPVSFDTAFLPPSCRFQFNVKGVSDFHVVHGQKKRIVANYIVEVRMYPGLQVHAYNRLISTTGTRDRIEMVKKDRFLFGMPLLHRITGEDRHIRFRDDPVLVSNKTKALLDSLDLALPQSRIARTYRDAELWQTEFAGANGDAQSRCPWVELDVRMTSLEGVYHIAPDGSADRVVGPNCTLYELTLELGSVTSLFHCEEESTIEKVVQGVLSQVRQQNPSTYERMSAMTKRVFPPRAEGAIPLPKPRKGTQMLPRFRVEDAENPGRKLRTVSLATEYDVRITHPLTMTAVDGISVDTTRTRGVTLDRYGDGLYRLTIAPASKVVEGGDLVRLKPGEKMSVNGDGYAPTRRIYVFESRQEAMLDLVVSIPTEEKEREHHGQNGKPKPRSNSGRGDQDDFTVDYTEALDDPSIFVITRKGRIVFNSTNPSVSTAFFNWDTTRHSREYNQLRELRNHLDFEYRKVLAEADSIQVELISEEIKKKYEGDENWFTMDRIASFYFRSPSVVSLVHRIDEIKGH